MTNNSWFHAEGPILFDPEEEDGFEIQVDRLHAVVPHRGVPEEITAAERLSLTPYGKCGDLGLQVILEHLSPNHIHTNDLLSLGSSSDFLNDGIVSHEVYKVPNTCKEVSKSSNDFEHCNATRLNTNELPRREKRLRFGSIKRLRKATTSTTTMA